MFSVGLVRIIAAVWLLTALVNARPADASCVVDNQGPCYRYWHTEMVVLGEVMERAVIGKQVVEEQYVIGSTFRLRLSVLERFRGVSDADAEVVLNAQDGECGFAPAVGDRVFVYANRDKDGAFWLSAYSSPLKYAKTDLAYARRAVRHAASAMVYGQVEHREDPVLDARAFTSLVGVRVRARGVGFDMTATTDGGGNYAIRLPGAGKYRIEVFPPRGMAEQYAGPTLFEIENPQECLRVDYQLLTNGRIRGVVVDEATGRPIPNLVVGAGDNFVSSKTTHTGAFDIGPFSKGNYELVARTGTGSVTLLPSAVRVASGRTTVLQPLTARLSRPLATVVLDLTGLSERGAIEFLFLGINIPIGRETEAAVALERGESFEVSWWNGTDTRKATFTVDSDVARVKLSALAWQPAQ